MTNSVAEQSSVQALFEAKRRLPRTLIEGTEAMRLAGTAYLPRHPAESPAAWESRLAGTVLLPAYRDAIDLACGLIFRKKIVAGDGVPEDAKPWLQNIDQAGLSVTQFAEVALRDAFGGVSYLVADYPRVQGAPTYAQEKAMGVRPYLIHVKASQVLGWRTQMVNGKSILTQFRYMECTTEPDGQFGQKDVQRVRVLEPGMVSVYVKPEGGGEWVLDPSLSGITSLREVPVVPIYTGRTAFMQGVPPLLDLAYKNVEHWQSSSDQRNILHVARVPLLALVGVDDGDVVIGPQNTLKLPIGGDAKWVEHSGQAIAAGRQDLLDLETQMQRMAGKILDSGVVKTATQSDTESTQAMSRLQAWAVGLNAGLNAAWAMCGKWIGQDLGTLAVNTDMDTSRPDAAMLTEIRNAVVAGLLSKETYLKILIQAEDVLPEGFDLQEELDRLERAAPDMTVVPDRVAVKKEPVA